VSPPLIGALVSLVVLAVWVARVRQRRKLLARLQAEWGQPRRGGERWFEPPPLPDGSPIDQQTWSDLDLDAVLAAIDRTETALGATALRARVAEYARWSDLPDAPTLADAFARDPSLRDDVGLELALAGRSAGQWLGALGQPGVVQVRWWYWAFPVLALAMLTSLLAIAIWPKALLVAFGIALLNVAVRVATAWQLPGVLGPMRQLGPVLGLARRVARRLPDALPTLTRIDADLKSMRRLRRIAKWVSRDPATDGEILASIWEYLNLLFILDANALFLAGVELREKGATLLRIMDWVGMVDVARGVASLRAEPRVWSEPRWSSTGPTVLEEAWHPLLEDPVTNLVDLVPGGGLLITGANMSGKSTYLRTLGVAVVLAHCLETCPARSYRGRPLQIMTLIQVRDDLEGGRSYFQVEADRVAGLLARAAGETPTLFIVDELLRGTNSVERIALTEAVMLALVRRDGPTPHVAVIATHDLEVAAAVVPPYAAWHFRETLAKGELTFDYRRREGPSPTRTGILVLEAAGAPAAVIADAHARAERRGLREGGGSAE